MMRLAVMVRRVGHGTRDATVAKMVRYADHSHQRVPRDGLTIAVMVYGLFSMGRSAAWP